MKDIFSAYILINSYIYFFLFNLISFRRKFIIFSFSIAIKITLIFKNVQNKIHEKYWKKQIIMSIRKLKSIGYFKKISETLTRKATKET